jgi:hypothetical protein
VARWIETHWESEAPAELSTSATVFHTNEPLGDSPGFPIARHSSRTGAIALRLLVCFTRRLIPMCLAEILFGRSLTLPAMKWLGKAYENMSTWVATQDANSIAIPGFRRSVLIRNRRKPVLKTKRNLERRSIAIPRSGQYFILHALCVGTTAVKPAFSLEFFHGCYHFVPFSQTSSFVHGCPSFALGR